MFVVFPQLSAHFNCLLPFSSPTSPFSSSFFSILPSISDQFIFSQKHENAAVSFNNACACITARASVSGFCACFEPNKTRHVVKVWNLWHILCFRQMLDLRKWQTTKQQRIKLKNHQRLCPNRSCRNCSLQLQSAPHALDKWTVRFKLSLAYFRLNWA